MSMECVSACEECKPVNPWPKSQSFITMGAASLAWLIGLYAVARERPRKLPVFLAASTVLMTLSRKARCARCPYYGEYCTMLIGKWTAVLFERSDKPLTTWSFLQEGLVGGVIFLYPLPELMKRGPRVFLPYQAALLFFLVISIFRSCAPCPLDICPVNRTLSILGMKRSGE